MKDKKITGRPNRFTSGIRLNLRIEKDMREVLIKMAKEKTARGKKPNLSEFLRQELIEIAKRGGYKC